jgi:hypothetical protein
VTATDLDQAALLEALHAALDADPSDAATRQVLADLLEDQGDRVAARGQRWQALYGKAPRRSPPVSREPCLSWDWWLQPADPWDDAIGKAALPEGVFVALAGTTFACHSYKEYPSRRAAEADLAQALETLASREAVLAGYESGPCPWCGMRRVIRSRFFGSACDGCGQRWTA